MNGCKLILTLAVAAGLSACGGAGDTNEAANLAAPGNDGMAMNTLAANEALAVDANEAAGNETNGVTAPEDSAQPSPPPAAPRATPKAERPKAKASAPVKAAPKEPAPKDDPHAGHDMNNMSH